jgi:predicted  nucleic acid-binding Zn-ribbon protein
MALKQDFAKVIESQIAVWQAQIKEHQEQMGKAGTEARAGYEKAVSTMRENAEQAGKLLHQVRDAGEGAWKDMQASSQQAFERLQKGWADALGRFL